MKEKKYPPFRHRPSFHIQNPHSFLLRLLPAKRNPHLHLPRIPTLGVVQVTGFYYPILVDPIRLEKHYKLLPAGPAGRHRHGKLHQLRFDIVTPTRGTLPSSSSHIRITRYTRQCSAYSIIMTKVALAKKHASAVALPPSPRWTEGFALPAVLYPIK